MIVHSSNIYMHILKKFWVVPQVLKQIEIAVSFNLILLEINLIHTPNLKIQQRI